MARAGFGHHCGTKGPGYLRHLRHSLPGPSQRTYTDASEGQVGMDMRFWRRGAAPKQAPGQSSGPLLVVDGLRVKYGSTTAVRDVSLSVDAGEIVAVLGANGAGKTSTLTAIMGIVKPAAGRVLLDGTDVAGKSSESIVRHGLAMSPEGRRIFGKLTVFENLRLGAGTHGQRQVASRYEEMVELFPVLGRKRNDFAGLLSGGEQQQLAIARALMSGPRLLLLDEPSLGLAPLVVESVFELIGSLRDRGITIVLVEQNVEQALELADRGYVLATGRVELEGTATQLREGSALEEAYLGLGVEG